MAWKEQKTGPRRRFPISSPLPLPLSGLAKAPDPAVATYLAQAAAGPATAFASAVAALTMTGIVIRTPSASASGGGAAVPENESGRDGNGNGTRHTNETGSASDSRGEAGTICRNGNRIRGLGVGGIGMVEEEVVVQGTRVARTIRGERAAMLMLTGLIGRESTDMSMRTKDEGAEPRALRNGARGIGPRVR